MARSGGQPIIVITTAIQISSQDPHSSTHGFWYSHVGWFLNEYNFATRKEVIKDWLKYPELIWLDRFSLIVVLLTAGGIYALGEWLAITWPQLGTSGLQLLVWGFVVSTVLLHPCHLVYQFTGASLRQPGF